MAEPLGPARPSLERLVDRARRHGGDRRARGRDAGVAVPQPRHDDGGAATRSRARTSRTRSPAASRRWTPASRACPRQRPFLANTEGLMRELRPGRPRAAHRRAGALGRARRPASTCCPRRRRSTAGWSRCCRSCRRSPTTRWSRAASATRPTWSSRSSRRSTTSRRPRRVCNYVTLWFRNISSLLSEGDRNGTWQRFIIVTTPQGPNNEGGPSSAPANGPTESTTTCTPTRTRTPRRPASRASARRATSRTCAGRPSRRNVPGHAAGAHRGLPTEGEQLMARARPPQPEALERLHRPDGRDRRRADPVLRLHQGHPVHAAASRLKAQFESANSIRPELAGADRGRRGRQGQVGRGRSRAPTPRVLVMELKDTALPLHANATRQDPPAHLPRGQLLRRPQAGHAGLAGSWTPATRSRSPRRRRRCSSTRC